MNVNDSQIKTILKDYREITIYGLSPDPAKPSHYVPVYLRDQHYEICGIYPKVHSVGGFHIVSTIAQIEPAKRKMVAVFRRSENIPEVVDEVLALGGVDVLWLQLGIAHPKAEARAEAAGLRVVSNRCLIIEHRRHFD